MRVLTAISIAIGVLTASSAQAATPIQFHVDSAPQVTDLGLAPQAEVRTITLSLTPPNLAAMEAYAASTVDPSSPNYRQFLTPAQVGARFGLGPVDLAQVVNVVKAQGLTVTRVYKNNLLIGISGTNAQLGAMFGSPIHTFRSAGQTYEAPLSEAAVPPQLSGLVSGMHGLNSRLVVRSNAVRLPQAVIPNGAGAAAQRVPTPNAAATATPGNFTTMDVAAQYNVTPLYRAGITGAGKTIGIATLAPYNQSDVYAYWDAVGLTVDRNRITDILVDGGPIPGDPSAVEGAVETTLDVEQSGGIAPGAKMRVYIAPGSESGFIDVFAQAVDDNIVDTLSVSWGGAEVFAGQRTHGALHAVFLQAAMQGIPVIAATGDSGAYEINNQRLPFRYPDCTTVLSTTYPASDPLVLGAGGTTLPVTLTLPNGTITIPTERAWGNDYWRDYVVRNFGQSAYYTYFFPVGGGGGVSVVYDRPAYQQGLAGVANSAPGQRLLCKPAVVGQTGTNYVTLGISPANVAGRNLPDVSLNADGATGFLVYQGGWLTNYGGTSFVAPQLNGIFTLIASARQSRLGFLQPQLYGAFRTTGYGAGSPFRPVTAGTNLFYASKAGYNPATGLGSLDVANLARAFGVQF